MKRTKIAPRLHEIVEDIHGHPDFLKRDGEVCARELRALLAVARAATRLRTADVNDLIAEDAVWKALDRLARLSRKRGERTR